MKTPHGIVSVAPPAEARGKELAEHIFLDTLAALNVRRFMPSKLKREGGALVAGGVSIPLLRAHRVGAFGKAAIRMAAVLGEILGGQVEAGDVVAPAEPSTKLY